MLFKCKEALETREGGMPHVIDEGDILYFAGMSIAPGGYEVAVMEHVRDGYFTGIKVRVRLDWLDEFFEKVPMKDVTLYLRQ